MKKLLYISVLLFAASYVQADGRDPSVFMTQAINKSSNTSVNTNSNSPAISTTAVLITGVFINSPGLLSKLEIFAARQSTGVQDNAALSANVRTTRIATIDTSTNAIGNYYPFNIFASSGLMWHNYGVTPADVTVTYLDKR